MKRNATSDLNHSNWDKEEEKEERGEFVTANKNIISQRKVIQARRKPTSNSTNNVFKSFSGFSNTINPPSNNMLSFTIDSSILDKNKEKHINSLKLLNQQFLECIQKHITENPVCVLTPTLDDYNKNLNIIKDKYPLTTMPDSKISSNWTEIGTTVSTPSTIPVFSFLKDKTEAVDNFQFGLKNADVPKPFTFSTTESLPLFGLPAASTAEVKNSTIGFSNSSSLFGIPSSSTMNTVAPIVDEEDEYVPPVAEVREFKENDSVYEVRCKLFYQLDSEWKNRGVGNLFIKPIEKGKFQLVLRADNSLATILLNVLINDKMPLSVTKNNISFVAMTDFCKEMKLTPLLIRVKTPEEAEALLEAMKRQL